MQIRTRITLQFVTLVAAIFLVALAYIYVEARKHILSEYAGMLRSKANLTAATAIAQMERDSMPLQTVPVRERQGPVRENVTIYDQAGRALFSFYGHAESFQPEWPAKIWDKGEDVCVFEGERMYVVLPFTSLAGQQYIVKAEAFYDRRELRQLMSNLILLYLGMLIFVALSGWLFAGRALAPINQVMDALIRIHPADMDRRLESPNEKDEIGRMVTAFNDLLDRIRQVLKAQKAFLAQVSHELKNPFTIITTQTDIALQQERSIPEYKALLKSIQQDVREVNVITDHLMQLARIQAGENPEDFAPVRVDELLWQVSDQLAKLNPDYRVKLDFNDLPVDEKRLVVAGHETLLRVALFNLMENGCKFSADNTVTVRLEVPDQGDLCLTVTDYGPGISEEEHAHVFEPFYRTKDAVKHQGTGIGLSLVKSIAAFHGIPLRIERLDPGGTRFVLCFPQHPLTNPN